MWTVLFLERRPDRGPRTLEEQQIPEKYADFLPTLQELAVPQRYAYRYQVRGTKEALQVGNGFKGSPKGPRGSPKGPTI